MTPLASALAAALDLDADLWPAADKVVLEGELAEHVANAAAYWAPVVVPADTVVGYVAARLEGEGLEVACVADVASLARVFGQLAIADLYLCAALSLGVSNALAKFDSTFGDEIERAVRHLDSSGDLGDEVHQILRDKLFVAAPGARLGIERYLGRGPLGRWLWVMATREGLMSRRRHRREIPLVDGHLGIAEGDIELDYLKREYRAEFRRAFAAAMEDLGSKERNLLHYHFVRRLTIDQVGAIYRVHRVTAFRWLRRARGQLLAATRAQLATRLNIDASEVDSILRLVQSRLEVSVERIRGDGPLVGAAFIEQPEQPEQPD